MTHSIIRGAVVALLAGGSLAALALPGPAGAAQTEVANADIVNFNIPRQEVANALEAFAQQSGRAIMFDRDRVGSRLLKPVVGSYTPEDALARLIEGSGLMMRAANEGTFVVGLLQTLTENEGGSARLAQAGGGSASAANTAGSTPEKQIEEIVVTAQKREERLQDVPISIAVLNGKELDSSTYLSVTDALRAAPGVDVSITGDQNNGGLSISVRGVSNSTPRVGGASPIAYYIDGTAYGFTRSAFLPSGTGLFDLERIEVLSGPQGTLYGANALNGVVRILTHNANTHAFELKARTSVSSVQDGGTGYGGDVTVNAPIVEGKLAARATVGYHDDAGWIDAPNQRDVNDVKGKTYRLKLRAEPSDTLSMDLSAWRSESDAGAPDVSNDARQISSIRPQPREHQFNSYGLQIDKKFPVFTLSSATSYFDYDNFGIYDGSVPGVNLQLTLNTFFKARVFSQEINLLSALEGPWHWSAGAFYRDAKETYFQIFDYFAPTTPDLVRNDYTDKSASAAVYGEFGRRFYDERLDLSVGLRYFHDDQSMKLNQAFVALPLTPFENSAKKVTPRAVLTWMPNREQTVYLSYAQGFRSGLVQQPQVQVFFANYSPLKPDTLTNYEIGSKGSLLDGRLSYEAAVYYIDWQDLQQGLTVQFTSGPSAGTFTQALVNGQSASGLGASFGLTATPFERFELSASVSWNDLAFDGDVVNQTAGGPVILARKGDRLAFSPKYTLGASTQYSFPLGASGWSGRVGLSADWTSRQNELRSTSAPTVIAPDPILITGARVSLESGDRWSATLYGDNIGDDDGGAPPNFPVEWTSRLRPRTYGLQLQYNFN